MSFRAPLILLVAFSASLFLPCSPVALARETDQFTTPRAPLPDFGPELSRKVVEIIESDRTGSDPDRVLAKWAGRNFFSSRVVRWMGKTQIPAEGPLTFRPRVSGSIYRRAMAPLPASFVFNAPTVRVHGYYMGSDKIDHFFQQGHLYFETVMRQKRAGVSEAEAIAAVVAHGVAQEHKYFGTAVSGVYSNADLAANYAGMKFYLNLLHPVRIGERVLPPLFERSGEGWRLRSGVDRDRLLQPYLSNHLDESLNPSRYRFSRKSIRSVIRARCDSWRQFYAERLDLVVAPAGRGFAAKWFGEEYGHWLPPSDEVSIATVCGSQVGAEVKSHL